MEKFFFILIAFVLTANNRASLEAAEPPELETLNRMIATEFKNEYYLTREDFCTAIAKLFIENKNELPELPFDDVSLVSPENIPFLAALYETGILAGVPLDGRLYMLPDEIITRQESITILGRVLGKSSDSQLAFADTESIAPYASGYAAWFVDNGIVSGYPDGRFGPKDAMTAGQLAILTIGTLGYKQLSGAATETYFGVGSGGHLDGGASTASFMIPGGVTVDDEGSLIVFDTYNNLIRRIRDEATETLAGSANASDLDENGFPKGYYSDGELSLALMNRPTDGVFNSEGHLLICDSVNNIIRIIVDGKVSAYKGAADAFLRNPMAIAIDKNDCIYIADALNNCIKRIDAEGNVSIAAGVSGEEGFSDGAAETALFRAPSGIAVSDDGSVIYVSDTGNHKIRKIENGTVITIAGVSEEFDEDGEPIGGFRNGFGAMFNLPMGLTLADGVLIVADSGNNLIRAITPSGKVITLAGNGESDDRDGFALEAMFNRPMGVCFYEGALYIADSYNNKIKVLPFDTGIYATEGDDKK